MPTAYAELCSLLKHAALLDSLAQLASWDQETYMPEKGAAARAESVALLATLIHERRTSPRVGELLAACEGDAGLTAAETPTGANLREIRRDYDKHTKVPAELVAEIAKVGSQAQEVWKKAREGSDFAMFRPWLERMIGLQRRKAECLGHAPGGEAYDALLDLYEPGATAAGLEAVFTPLRARLTDLLGRVRGSKAKVRTRCLEVKIDPAAQHAFGLAVIEAMGFDLTAGRVDTTTHPFCSGFAPGDTRLTTRYREAHFTDALYSTLHEMGHGLYEQGLPKMGKDGGPSDLYGTPLADSISLGIHESQSRMWENFVGRSKAFWKWALPKSKKQFGKALSKFDAKEYFAAVNTAAPSLIRVEADETTYNLHVMIRFEIERALLRGDLAVKDLPGAWNGKYKEYLGVKVPDDRRGCLQDVHWSFGLFGYFPTYTLGNLYAAQFWEKINQDIPDLNKQIAKGRFDALKKWLNTKIHAHGRRYTAGDLCTRVTGAPLSSEPLLRHLSAKAEQVYGV
ncbi:MAG: thermostable carboxypeptidase 1 [Phycisphaerae bacterium]|nr:MAG: thermostable carboxypeptidase 1 [Phycisphaerae bacterium]